MQRCPHCGGWPGEADCERLGYFVLRGTGGFKDKRQRPRQRLADKD